jgi:hypothetical protein
MKLLLLALLLLALAGCAHRGIVRDGNQMFFADSTTMAHWCAEHPIVPGKFEYIKNNDRLWIQIEEK